MCQYSNVVQQQLQVRLVEETTADHAALDAGTALRAGTAK
jgi:hypothetical protein